MPALRRPVALLAALCLAVPAAASAQGAGDNQYQDPFGTSSTPTANTTTPKAKGKGGLGQAPPTAPSSGQAPSTTPAAPATPSTPRARTRAGGLPNTGLDARVIALLGLGLLASGIGLRLRTVDERLF